MTVDEQPGQLGRLGHVRLDEEGRLLGVEPQREQVDEHVEDVLAEPPGVADAGQRVVVGDEVIGVVALLERDVLPDRAEVVADVQGARGLDSRQDSHGFEFRVSGDKVVSRGRCTSRDERAHPPSPGGAASYSLGREPQGGGGDPRHPPQPWRGDISRGGGRMSPLRGCGVLRRGDFLGLTPQALCCRPSRAESRRRRRSVPQARPGCKIGVPLYQFGGIPSKPGRPSGTGPGLVAVKTKAEIVQGLAAPLHRAGRSTSSASTSC